MYTSIEAVCCRGGNIFLSSFFGRLRAGHPVRGAPRGTPRAGKDSLGH